TIKVCNKAPLVNENLKNCLNTRDGRVVASLVLDFLQVFDLDFSRSVFEPEISLESRDLLCKDLDLNPNPKSPLLLELVQRHHQHRTKDRTKDWTKDQGPSEKQLEWVRRRFDFYDRDGAGSINKDDAKRVFFDLFPKMNRHVLEQFVLEELRDRAGFETKGVSGLDPGLTRDPGLDSGLNPDPQRDLDLDHVDDGDSFFDDPLPAPQKTYGW
uniref:EF-hand domain-containing protein n=1 Tax=Periophthalmus magnuspinnatus TaxID=409849 RepID=A0A3B3ZDM6_9GOBI